MGIAEWLNSGTGNGGMDFFFSLILLRTNYCQE